MEKALIGVMLFPKIDRFASIPCLADHGHVCLPSDERNQAFADNVVIISDEHSDTRSFCIPNFRRFLCGRLWFLGRLLRLRRCFLFRCHNVNSPLQGRTTITFVPLPRELVIFNSPPICSTRSRMPVRPTPSCRSFTLNPPPSSLSSTLSSLAL